MENIVVDFKRKPLEVQFESSVELTIHEARLSAAGILQCDPRATVDIVTARRVRLGGNQASFSFCSKSLAHTSQKIFTASPTFDEKLSFNIGHTFFSSADATQGKAANETESTIVITFEDHVTHQFLGRAYAPFSPYSPSVSPPSAPVRLMLQPRNILDPTDPLYIQDTIALQNRHLDDFGFVTISWKVLMVPLGGGIVQDTVATAASQDPAAGAVSASPQGAPVSLPVGITLKAAWLVAAENHPQKDRSLQYRTSVEFGDHKRFRIEADKPLFLKLHAIPQLQHAIFYCSCHSIVRPEMSRDIPVTVPLPSLLFPGALNRDLHWILPVRSVWGEDFGMLVASVRISKRSLDGQMPDCPSNTTCVQINNPLHQEEFSHTAVDYHRAPPDTPLGAYQPLFWESEEHIKRSMTRRRRREVILAAKPTEEHIRHLFDVLMGRSTLDEAVARVAASFFQCPANHIVALQLKELMVAFAFNSEALSVLDAARFLFIAFRSNVEDAISVEEFHFMLQFSLLEKTLDMPEEEVRRWVKDIVGSETTVIRYADFSRFVLQNFALWFLLGTPLQRDQSTVSAALAHLSDAAAVSSYILQPLSTEFDKEKHLSPRENAQMIDGMSSAAEAGSMAAPREDLGPGSTKSVQFSLSKSEEEKQAVWRTFVVHVDGDPPKAFSVTAHCQDKVRDVMKMIEETAGIKAECQQWKLNDEVIVEPHVKIGSTTLGIEPSLKAGTALSMSEIWVHEIGESVLINFIYKDKNKRWQQRVPTKDKVLRIRAGVQQKTLIPLSRCSLRLIRPGKCITLQDRHLFSYYSPEGNDTIEVSQENY